MPIKKKPSQTERRDNLHLTVGQPHPPKGKKLTKIAALELQIRSLDLGKRAAEFRAEAVEKASVELQYRVHYLEAQLEHQDKQLKVFLEKNGLQQTGPTYEKAPKLIAIAHSTPTAIQSFRERES